MIWGSPPRKKETHSSWDLGVASGKAPGTPLCLLSPAWKRRPRQGLKIGWVPKQLGVLTVPQGHNVAVELQKHRLGMPHFGSFWDTIWTPTSGAQQVVIPRMTEGWWCIARDSDFPCKVTIQHKDGRNGNWLVSAMMKFPVEALTKPLWLTTWSQHFLLLSTCQSSFPIFCCS
jgi:hypothetical protein